VQAVARKLLCRDVAAELTVLGALADQVPDHVAEPLLCSADRGVSMQKRHQFGVVVSVTGIGAR